MKRYSALTIIATGILGILGILASFDTPEIGIIGFLIASLSMFMLISNVKNDQMIQIIMSLNQSTEEERKLFLKKLTQKRGHLGSKVIIGFLLIVLILGLIVIGLFVLDIQVKPEILRALGSA